jgi:hypothetical protein
MSYNFNIGGSRLKTTPENAYIFVHAPLEQRGYDHIFIQTDDNGGYFLWRTILTRSGHDFDEITDGMMAEGYKAKMSETVSDFDSKQFNDYVMRQTTELSIEDFIE